MKCAASLFTGVLVAAVVAVAGCGSAAGGPAAVESTPDSSPSAATLSASDIAGAQLSALALFIKLPLNAGDPSAGYVWTSGPASMDHLSSEVKARLAALASTGYFSDGGGCGEDYLTGTQNGLFTEPSVVSSVGGADRRVAVEIKRGAMVPDLTALMANQGRAWVAVDLQSGSGPSASIFSTKPNC
jgi:hypothetical protein